MIKPRHMFGVEIKECNLTVHKLHQFANISIYLHINLKHILNPNKSFIYEIKSMPKMKITKQQLNVNIVITSNNLELKVWHCKTSFMCLLA